MTDKPNDGPSGDGSLEQGNAKESKFQIQIDRVHYTVHEAQMSGAEIRAVPDPDIGPERDLFEVVPGHSDRKIENADVIEMSNGKRFFTAPAHINPGQSD